MLISSITPREKSSPGEVSSNGERSDEMTFGIEQREKLKRGQGFVAALDQSGGSTPKALDLYGLDESSWSTDKEMFDLVHQMRTRIMQSRAFDGHRILAAILFDDTLRRQVDGVSTAEFLWIRKSIVPILKIDRGLAPEYEGVQLMQPIVGLEELLAHALQQNVFGTKMRSVIRQAHRRGIEAIVEQQFKFARSILEQGLCPIIEPEVDIHCPEKAKAETLLFELLSRHLDTLDESQEVLFKLTLPEEDNLYAPLVRHPKVLRVLALSGGYRREEANSRLTKQHGVVASFSRALTEGLSIRQSDDEFDQVLDASIQSIFDASNT